MRAGHQRRPRCRCRAACSRRRSAGRWCRDDACTRDDLLARHGEHAERVVVAQVRLGGEREPGEVGRARGRRPGARPRRRTPRGSAARCRTHAAVSTADGSSWRAASSSREAVSIGSSMAGSTSMSRTPASCRIPARSGIRRVSSLTVYSPPMIFLNRYSRCRTTPDEGDKRWPPRPPRAGFGPL